MLAAVKPVDVIDEMLIVDVASLEWEILRWRRLKTCLIRARGRAALKTFLRQNLDYDAYSDVFADRLTEILQENFPDNQAEDAQTLALSVRGMNRTLSTRSTTSWTTSTRIWIGSWRAQAEKAKEVAQGYVQALAREIAGIDANAELQELARRVAEAQIDLRRVRDARHQLLSRAPSNPSYEARQIRDW